MHGLTGNSCQITKVLFLEDGQLASGLEDGSINLWNPVTGELLTDMKAHNTPILSLAQLPNGWLASTSGGKSIRLWSLKDKKLEKELNGHTKCIFSLQVLPNGNLASCSFDNSIKIWNPYLTEGHLLSTIIGHQILKQPIQLGLLSNGHLVTCSDEADQDNTIRVLDTTAGTIVKSIDTKARNACSLLVLSNDRIAVGYHQDATIRIFEPSEDQSPEPIELDHQDIVLAFAQLPNGYLVSAERKRYSTLLNIWNLESKRLVQQSSLGEGVVRSLSISADKMLVSGGFYDNKLMKVWPLKY